MVVNPLVRDWWSDGCGVINGTASGGLWRRVMSRFEKFSAGQEVGGVRVIEALTPDAVTTAECRYRVQYLCCGMRIVMPHKILKARITNNRKTCHVCAKNLMKRRIETELRMGAR